MGLVIHLSVLYLLTQLLLPRILNYLLTDFPEQLYYFSLIKFKWFLGAFLHPRIESVGKTPA